MFNERVAWKPDKDVDNYILWDSADGNPRRGSAGQLIHNERGDFAISEILSDADTAAENFYPYKMYPLNNGYIFARDLDEYWFSSFLLPMLPLRFLPTGVDYHFAAEELKHGNTWEHFRDVEDFFTSFIWTSHTPPRNAHDELLMERLRPSFHRLFGDNWLGWASMVWRFNTLNAQHHEPMNHWGIKRDAQNVELTSRVEHFAKAFARYDWKNVYLILNAIEPHFKFSFDETEPVELITDALESTGWENLDAAITMLNQGVDFWEVPDYLDAGIDAELVIRL